VAGRASVGNGGTLNLSDTVVATILPAIRFGNALLSQLPQAVDDVGNAYSPLAVSTAFFSSGGFANVSFTASGITLPAGVTLAPTVASLSANPFTGVATPILLPSGIRQASSITLHATGDLVNRGGPTPTLPYQFAVDSTFYSLNIAGSITTDPLGSIALTGDQIAIVSGNVTAPGGNISLGGGTATYGGPPPIPLTGAGVWLTQTGSLSVGGTAERFSQRNGAIFDDVLPGGQVKIRRRPFRWGLRAGDGRFGEHLRRREQISDPSECLCRDPGHAGITPYDPYISNTSTSFIGPSVGKQVYLNGIPGLPAGTYTLLPGPYAELPGAFLVTVNTSPGAKTVLPTQAPIRPVQQTDGSYLVSGYMVRPDTGTTDQHWSVFQVMSDAVARKYTEIDNSYANTFFPAQAAAKGTAIPRLPQDAGQFSIAATRSLSFQGTSIFDHPNGLGGLADINANQILVVDGTTAAALAAGSASVADYAPGGKVGGDTDPDQWNPIVLAASDLDKLGVESLLLGGSRTFNTNGVLITASATEVVIANSTANPVRLPDIQLIASPNNPADIVLNTVNPGGGGGALTLPSAKPGIGQVIIAPGAVLQATGAVAPGAPTTYAFTSQIQKTPALQSVGGVIPYYASQDIINYYRRPWRTRWPMSGCRAAAW
jgi:hypothetical protein